MHLIRQISLSIVAALTLSAGNALAVPDASAGVPMLSGGVGEEDFDAVQGVKSDFNTKLLFTEATGAYLSDVTVVIKNSKGEEIASVITQGPILLVKLKPGKYSLKATIGGYTKDHKFSVGGKGMSNVHIAFPMTENVIN